MLKHFDDLKSVTSILMCLIFKYHKGGGGGLTSIIKVYTDVRLKYAILFRPSSI